MLSQPPRYSQVVLLSKSSLSGLLPSRTSSPDLSIREAVVNEPRTDILAVSGNTLITQQTSSTANTTHPTVMSWAAGAGGTAGGALHDREQLLPGYEVARVPTKPVVYTFSPQGANALILVPQPDAPDTRPLYHISVAMNVFNPYKFITTLRQGGAFDGNYIAEFEMGTSTSYGNTITMYGKQQPMLTMVRFIKAKTMSITIYYGNLAPPQSTPFSLAWSPLSVSPVSETSGIVEIAGKKTLVAKFRPPPIIMRPNSASCPPATLTLLPEAHSFPGLVDQIVLSVMIMGRRRLVG